MRSTELSAQKNVNINHQQLSYRPSLCILLERLKLDTVLTQSGQIISKGLGQRWQGKGFKKLSQNPLKEEQLSLHRDGKLSGSYSLHPSLESHDLSPGHLLCSLLARFFRLLDSTVDSAYLKFKVNVLLPLVQYHITDWLKSHPRSYQLWAERQVHPVLWRYKHQMVLFFLGYVIDKIP